MIFQTPFEPLLLQASQIKAWLLKMNGEIIIVIGQDDSHSRQCNRHSPFCLTVQNRSLRFQIVSVPHFSWARADWCTYCGYFTRRESHRGQRCHGGSGVDDSEEGNGGRIKADYTRDSVCSGDQSGRFMEIMKSEAFVNSILRHSPPISQPHRTCCRLLPL